MRIKFFILTLILLGFSFNIQAQVKASEKKITPRQQVKKEHLSTSSINKKKISKQKKNEARRRNMAKYKAMTEKRKPISSEDKGRKKD